MNKIIITIIVMMMMMMMMMMTATTIVLQNAPRLSHSLAGFTEEERIADAINSQNNEVKQQQEEVINLLGRIVEEIEKCSEGRQVALYGSQFAL